MLKRDAGYTSKERGYSSSEKKQFPRKTSRTFSVMSGEYQDRTLYIFGKNSTTRNICLKVSDSRIFEAFIFLMIFLNSICLAIFDYQDRDSLGTKNSILEKIGKIFTAIFALEFVVKTVARGFVLMPNAYLRNGWNILDFIVVISGIIELFLDSIKLKSLRLLRVLRPLKSLNAIPSLKKQVLALIQSMPDFINVAAFMLFILTLFAIFGMSQYSGITYNRCRLTPFPNEDGTWPIDKSIDRLCSINGYGKFHCPAGRYCGNPMQYPGTVQDDVSNWPIGNYGITNFDNLGTALLSVYMMIGDSWQKYMIQFFDVDFQTLGAFFSISLIIVGSFFLMNLILAAIIQAFIRVQKEEIEAQIKMLPEPSIGEDEDFIDDEGVFDRDSHIGDGRTIDRTLDHTMFAHDRDASEDCSPKGNTLRPLSKGSVFSNGKIRNTIKPKPMAFGQQRDFIDVQQQQQEATPQKSNALGRFLNSRLRDESTPNMSQRPFERSTPDTLNNSIFDQSMIQMLPETVKEEDEGCDSDIPELDKNGIYQRKRASKRIEDQIKKHLNGTADWTEDEKPGCSDGKLETTAAGHDLKFLRPLIKHRREIEEYRESKRSHDDSCLEARSRAASSNMHNINSDCGEPDRNVKLAEIKVSKWRSTRVLLPSKKLQSQENTVVPKAIDEHTEIKVQSPSIESSMNIQLLHKNSLGKKRVNIMKKFSNEDCLSSPKMPESILKQSSLKKQNTQEKRESCQQVQRKHSHKELSFLVPPSYSNNTNGNMLDKPQASSKMIHSFNVNIDSKLSSKSGSLNQSKSSKAVDPQTASINQVLRQVRKNQSGSDIKDKIGKQSDIRHLASMRVGLELTKDKQDQKQLKRFFEQAFIEKRSFQNNFYRVFYIIANNRYFINFISAIIIVNTFLLSLDSYPSNVTLTKRVEVINLILSIVFFIEMIVKMVGLGLKGYFMDRYNFFDAFIVFITSLDIIISNVRSQSGFDGSSQMTALRAFRLLRVFKLANTWKKLNYLLKTIWRTLTDVASFSILLFLVIFTYTLIGLEIFAHKAKFNQDNEIDIANGQPPIHNFDTFFDAITTVFIVLTNDNWSVMYYAYFRAVSGPSSTIFFLSLVLLGQKVLLNLFLAILLQNFDESAIKQRIENQLEDEEKKKLAISGRLQISWFILLLRSIKASWKNFWRGLIQKCGIVSSSTEDRTDIRHVLKKKSTFTMNESERWMTFSGTSLNFFSQSSSFRIIIYKIIISKFFEYFIITLIAISAVQLALDTPLLEPDSHMDQSLYWVDFFTTIAFSIEATMKIIAHGFLFNGDYSYLRNPWNILDFTIVSCSFVSLSPLSSKLKTLKMFRILKALRIVSRNEGIKVVISALIQAVPNIANVAIIMLLFFVIFAIILVSFFKGKLFYCDETTSLDYMSVSNVIAQKWDCLNSGGAWKNHDYRFDNIIVGAITLFVMATTAGWSEIMTTTVETTEIDYVNDNKGANSLWTFFFMLFIIVGSFFFLNLFVGVLVSTFNSEKDRIGGYDLLTDKQKDWIETRLLILRSSVIKKQKPPSENPFRIYMFRLQMKPWFSKTFMMFIILNSVILTIQWYGQSSTVTRVTDLLNQVLTGIFAIEAFIKITALGKSYFKIGWNIFDFTVVSISILTLIISQLSTFPLSASTTVIRSFRILRILRITKRAKSLTIIMNTFIISLPAIANVGSLLLLFLYIYSIIGMQIFGEMKQTGVMNDFINFEHFGNAFLTLFIVATGDSWNSIMYSFSQEKSVSYDCEMHDTFGSPPDIYTNGPDGCGHESFSYIFFITYIFLVNLVFLKLFIAIVLQAFQDNQKRQNKLFNHDMLEHFKQVWAEYDPDGTSFIKMSDLRNLLNDLEHPLGFSPEVKENRYLQDKFIAKMELPTYQNFSSYQFLDVLDALSLRTMVMEYARVKALQEEAGKIGASNFLSNAKNSKISPQPLNRQVSMTVAKASNTSCQDPNSQEEIELQIKQDIKKEVNKILFELEGKKIKAVKEMKDSELRNQQMRDSINARQDAQLTSLHQAAAQIAIDHMKYIVMKRKAENQIKQIQKQKEELMKIEDEKELIDRLKKEEEDEEKKRKQQEEERIEKRKKTDTIDEIEEISMTSSSSFRTSSSMDSEGDKEEDKKLEEGVVQERKPSMSKKKQDFMRKKSIFVDENGLQRLVTKSIIIEEKERQIEETKGKKAQLEVKIQKSMQKLVDLQIEARKIKNDSKLLAPPQAAKQSKFIPKSNLASKAKLPGVMSKAQGAGSSSKKSQPVQADEPKKHVGRRMLLSSPRRSNVSSQSNNAPSQDSLSIQRQRQTNIKRKSNVRMNQTARIHPAAPPITVNNRPPIAINPISQAPPQVSSMGGTGEAFSLASRGDSIEITINPPPPFNSIVEDVDEERKSLDNDMQSSSRSNISEQGNHDADSEGGGLEEDEYEEEEKKSPNEDRLNAHEAVEDANAAAKASGNPSSLNSHRWEEMVNHLFPKDSLRSSEKKKQHAARIGAEIGQRHSASMSQLLERSITDLLENFRDIINVASAERVESQRNENDAREEQLAQGSLALPRPEGINKLAEPSQ